MPAGLRRVPSLLTIASRWQRCSWPAWLMAAGQHDPSRRALLGAAVGLPLLGGIGTDVTPPPGFTRSPYPSKLGEDWDAALAAFEAAEAAVREIEAATAGYALEDEEALLPAHDAACEAMEAALGRMLRAPVADWAAFAVKLELFFGYEVEPNSVDAEVAAAVRADVRRLAGF